MSVKYILINKGKGTYNNTNPLSENDLLQIEKDDKELVSINVVSNGGNPEEKNIILNFSDGSSISDKFPINPVYWENIINRPIINDYKNWSIQVNGGEKLDIESNDVLNLIAGNNVTLSRNGQDITIDATDTVQDYYFNFSNNLGDGIQVNKGDVIKILTKSSNSNLKTSINGSEITIERVPKPSVNNGSTSPLFTYSKDYMNNIWHNITASNPTITLDGNINYFEKNDEIEGTFSGTGVLNIEGINGITLTYPDAYFEPKIPEGGVFGIKFISDTEAHVFGTLQPIGL